MRTEWFICGKQVFFFFFLQKKHIADNVVGWLWGPDWVLNTWFDRKFSEKQFSDLVFFHKNAYSARYLQKTVFRSAQTPTKKKVAGGYCGIFSMFFGHQSASLSTITPLPARFALFFPYLPTLFVIRIALLYPQLSVLPLAETSIPQSLLNSWMYIERKL